MIAALPNDKNFGIVLVDDVHRLPRDIKEGIADLSLLLRRGTI